MGGELTLRNRDSGGLEARLSLPRTRRRVERSQEEGKGRWGGSSSVRREA
jgi:hypothetical protein